MSDTPIFDQLARERNYNRMIAAVKVVPAWTGTSTKVAGIMAPGMYVDEWTGGQTDKIVNAAHNSTEEDEMIVFAKPIPVTTLAELAKGTRQE